MPAPPILRWQKVATGHLDLAQKPEVTSLATEDLLRPVRE
jgi:hypothetical protein